MLVRARRLLVPRQHSWKAPPAGRLTAVSVENQQREEVIILFTHKLALCRRHVHFIRRSSEPDISLDLTDSTVLELENQYVFDKIKLKYKTSLSVQALGDRWEKTCTVSPHV